MGTPKSQHTSCQAGPHACSKNNLGEVSPQAHSYKNSFGATSLTPLVYSTIRQARVKPSQSGPGKRKRSKPLPAETDQPVTELVWPSRARKQKASPPKLPRKQLGLRSPHQESLSSEQPSKVNSPETQAMTITGTPCSTIPKPHHPRNRTLIHQITDH